MALAKKVEFEAEEIAEVVAPASKGVEVARASASAADSPVFALQQRIENELNSQSFRSRRDGTAALLVVCIATWLAGVLLYAML